MSRKSYAAALDEVLAPMEFRQGADRTWSRTVGTTFEQVSLQTSQIAGTTANLWTKNLAAEDLLRQAIPWRPPVQLGGKRIGHLMDGYDRWWKNDPSGPDQLAAVVERYAPPYFEQWRTLEEQAQRFGRSNSRWTSGSTGSQMYLAATLHLMGEFDEACKALLNPPRTLANSLVEEAASLRKFLGCGPFEARSDTP